jgi:hypothetical protein
MNGWLEPTTSSPLLLSVRRALTQVNRPGSRDAWPMQAEGAAETEPIDLPFSDAKLALPLGECHPAT